MLFLGYARNDTKTGRLGEALTGSNHNAIAYPYQLSALDGQRSEPAPNSIRG